MENDFRATQKKAYSTMRMVYDVGIAVLLLGMAVVMFFADKMGLEQLADKDNEFFRYFFGGLCLLYGSFRLYRGIKRQY